MIETRQLYGLLTPDELRALYYGFPVQGGADVRL